MPILLVVLIIDIMVSSVSLRSSKEKLNHEYLKSEERKGFSSVTNSFVADRSSYFKTEPYSVGDKAKTIGNKLIIIDSVLQRTCRTLNILALANNCLSPRSVNTSYSFIIRRADNNLLPTWEGSSSSTFTCSDIAGYGRYLAQTAIPKEFILTNNLKYNLMDVVDTERHDPCGYIELVKQ